MKCDRVSDRLAKELQQHLHNAAESNGERSWPSTAGWKDFLAGDRPETDDPVEMAIEAVWYLADCEGGQWKSARLCFQAAMAFLREKRGHLPPQRKIQELRGLLEACPNREHLERWFRESYPPRH